MNAGTIVFHPSLLLESQVAVQAVVMICFEQHFCPHYWEVGPRGNLQRVVVLPAIKEVHNRQLLVPNTTYPVSSLEVLSAEGPISGAVCICPFLLTWGFKVTDGMGEYVLSVIWYEYCERFNRRGPSWYRRSHFQQAGRMQVDCHRVFQWKGVG